jgi:hypothetical protein
LIFFTDLVFSEITRLDNFSHDRSLKFSLW